MSCCHSRGKSYIIVNSFLQILGRCSVVKNTKRILEAVGKEVENEAEILLVPLHISECSLYSSLFHVKKSI